MDSGRDEQRASGRVRHGEQKPMRTPDGIAPHRIAELAQREADRFRGRAAEIAKRVRQRRRQAISAACRCTGCATGRCRSRSSSRSAKGATITDIDGNQLDDFCLGDTGSMFGHSPPPVARAIRRQAKRGLTYMLPSEDALAVGRLLARKIRPAALADRHHRHRRQPLRPARRPRRHRPAEDPRLQRLLSWRGRGDFRAAGERQAGQPAAASPASSAT